MRVQVRAREVELSELLRAHVGRRLALVLGRFGTRIDKVLVQFTAGDARPAGRDRRCRIDVALRPRALSVEDADPDPFVAVDRASDRISRSIARALEMELERERDDGPLRPRPGKGPRKAT